MTALATLNPISQYFDLDGSPLDGGYLYFGQVNQNPETNPVTVYWDEAGTQPAAQPVRTLNGGPSRSGTPAIIYTIGNYSLTVRDQRRRIVFSHPNSGSFSNDQALQDQITATLNNLDDGSDALHGAGMVAFDYRRNYAIKTLGWAEKLFTIDVRWFGPDNGALFDGVTDDTAAWQAAVNWLPNSGGRIVFGRGKTKISRLDILNKSNVWIEGEPGFSGSYNSTNFGSTIVSTNIAGPAFYFQNGVGCGVRGVQIKGAGTAIQYDGCLGFRVEGCNIRENGVGIQAFGNGVGLILNNMIRDNTVAGIRLAQQSGDTIVMGNDIGASGINVHVCTGNCHITQNHIFSSKTGGSGRGVLVDATFVSADAVIRHCEISGNLIANNDMQIEIKGTSLADRDIRDVHIHTNHIHQADDGGEGFDGAFAYGQGVLIQNADRVHVHHNNIIGSRDYGVKAVNCLGGAYVERNVIRSGNAAGVIFDLVQLGRIERNEFLGNVGTALAMRCTTGGNYTQNNHVAGNTFSGNGAVYSEDANTRANFIYDNLGGILADYALSVTAPVSQLRHVGMAGATETINQSLVLNGMAWNGPRLLLGTNQLWVDGAGRLRIKGSAPVSDTDGTVVGAQS